MRAKYLFGAVVISFASCASATAPKQLSVQAVDMQSELCTVNSATNDELSVHTIGFVRLLDRASEINKNSEKFIKSRKWKEGVAVGEQMNSAEAIDLANCKSK